MTSSNARSATVITAALVGFHLALGVGLISGMVFVVPRFEKAFADFGLQVPAITQWLFAISHWFVNYWYVLPLTAFPPLVGEGVATFLLYLNPRAVNLRRLWLGVLFGLPGMAFLILVFLGIVGIGLPWLKVMDSLSR